MRYSLGFPAALLSSLSLTVLAAPSEQGATGIPIKGLPGFYQLNPPMATNPAPLALDGKYGLTQVYCRGELELVDDTNTQLGCLGSDARQLLPGDPRGCGRFVAGITERTITRGGGYQTFSLISLDFWQQYGKRELPQKEYYCDLSGNEYPAIRCDYREVPAEGKLSWNERTQSLGGSWGRGGVRGVHDSWTLHGPEALGGDKAVYSGGSGKVRIRCATSTEAEEPAPGLPAFLRGQN